MARTRQTAHKSTSGKAPPKNYAAMRAARARLANRTFEEKETIYEEEKETNPTSDEENNKKVTQ